MSIRSPYRLVSRSAALLLATLSASPASAGDSGFSAEEFLAPQAVAETFGVRRDPSERVLERLALQERLAAARVDAALARPFRVEIPTLDRDRIDRTGTNERRYLVGVGRPVGVDIQLSASEVAAAAGAAVAVGPGVARGIGNQEIVWTAAFEARGASALRLQISGLDLPKDAELYVYNLAGQAFGPYRGKGPLGDGELYTHTVFGERLLLQLHARDGADAVRFRVEEVGVMGRRFQPARFGATLAMFDSLAPAASNLCSYNADCVINASCQSTSVVNGAKDAIASILFRSGGSYYICTGGLIADSDAAGIVPYFLTANHCISSDREASSVETYFDYATTCSNPDCTQPYNDSGDTVGATLKNASSSDDHSLLQLSAVPDSSDGVEVYLGWTSVAVANTDNAALYRISHPSGAPQAYSEQQVDTGAGTCGTLPRGRYIYSRDTLGATEGGSSGSPVLNGAGQIVGQLYGVCGFDINNVCNAADNATVDGAFANAYPSLQPFLNAGGGGSCSPSGASCAANSDCCSNNCKGKPGAKTCK
jgi:hypothetical protein